MDLDSIEISSSPQKAMFYVAGAKTVKGTAANVPHSGDKAVAGIAFQKSFNFSSATDLGVGRASLQFTIQRPSPHYPVAIGLVRYITNPEQTGVATWKDRYASGFTITAQDNDSPNFHNWAIYYVGVVGVDEVVVAGVDDVGEVGVDE